MWQELWMHQGVKEGSLFAMKEIWDVSNWNNFWQSSLLELGFFQVTEQIWNFIDSHCQAFPLLVIVRGNAMENYTIPSHYKCLMKFSCAKCFQGLTTKRRYLHRYLCKCVRWSTQLQMQLLALMWLLKLPKFPTALFTLIILINAIN